MSTEITALIVAALLVVVASAVGFLPLWPAVLLLAIAMLIR